MADQSDVDRMLERAKLAPAYLTHNGKCYVQVAGLEFVSSVNFLPPEVEVTRFHDLPYVGIEDAIDIIEKVQAMTPLDSPDSRLYAECFAVLLSLRNPKAK